MPFIEFRNVGVSYKRQENALSACSLTIEKGEFVFLVGKTGAGKSTLLKLLTREVGPDSGAVILNGKEINRQSILSIPKLRRGMGIVPQDYALLPKKTVAENIAYASRAAGKTRKQTKRRVPFILIGVHLDHKAESFPEELSGGEKQRVAIGRALVNDPPLLLADEPTGNLDPEHSLEVMQLLLELNARGTTVIVASHDMMVIERLNRRIVRLDQGKIISDTGPIVQEIPIYEPEPDLPLIDLAPLNRAPIDLTPPELEKVQVDLPEAEPDLVPPIDTEAIAKQTEEENV